MKSLIIILALLPVMCLSQSFSKDELWKGAIVQDILGKEIRYKRQDFIKFKGDSILLFQFNELMSMETGEIKIETKIDTLTIDSKEVKSSYELTHKSQTLKLEQINENEFKVFYPKFILTFTRISNLEKPVLGKAQFQEFIVGSKFIEIDPNTKKETGSLSKYYQENGKAQYQTIGSSSSWESAYKIVSFEGYIFLKGITSAPVLLSHIDGNIINGLEADYRFVPKKVSLMKTE